VRNTEAWKNLRNSYGVVL